MPDSSYFRSQADVFDRVADQCSVPELISYYRALARDYRARAEDGAEPTQSAAIGPAAADEPQPECPE